MFSNSFIGEESSECALQLEIFAKIFPIVFAIFLVDVTVCPFLLKKRYYYLDKFPLPS